MPRTMKHQPTMGHTRESSLVSLLSGWVQQGVENFFATQRILVDLAMRQNASAMTMLRERLADPAYCPVAILTELTGEGMSNFIEGQNLLLNLAQQEYEIVANGVKERVGEWPVAVAMTDLMRRSFDTFVDMQQEFLKIASKQTHNWLEAVKAGKTYDPEGLVEAARESFDNFVHSQKKFLDILAQEADKATSGKEVPAKKKKTELLELAYLATESFIDAHKKMIDVAGRQMNANLKATSRTLNMIAPAPFMKLPDLTREGVKSFVDAEKALIDTVMKRHPEHKPAPKAERRRKRPGRRMIKVETAATNA